MKLSYLFLKRVFDLVVSLFGLLLLWPVFLLVSLLICLEDHDGSPGFAQIRVEKVQAV